MILMSKWVDRLIYSGFVSKSISSIKIEIEIISSQMTYYILGLITGFMTADITKSILVT